MQEQSVGEGNSNGGFSDMNIGTLISNTNVMEEVEINGLHTYRGGVPGQVGRFRTSFREKGETPCERTIFAPTLYNSPNAGNKFTNFVLYDLSLEYISAREQRKHTSCHVLQTRVCVP
jgi:hypothetical protein